MTSPLAFVEVSVGRAARSTLSSIPLATAGPDTVLTLELARFGDGQVANAS